MIEAKLVIVGADIKPGEYKLKLPTVIGRSKEANLKLVHPLVSRQHCTIYEQDGQLMVRDLGSLNGTFLEDERITEAPLPAGALLKIGTVTFRAVYGDMTDLMAPGAGKATVVGAAAETHRVADASNETKPRAGKPAAAEKADDDFSLDWLDDADPANSDTDISDTSVAKADTGAKAPKPKPANPAEVVAPAAAADEDDDDQFMLPEEDEGHEKQSEEEDDGLDDFFKSIS